MFGSDNFRIKIMEHVDNTYRLNDYTQKTDSSKHRFDEFFYFPQKM